MASVLARVGVVLGAALLVIGAFVPWLRLSSSPLGVNEQGFSHWSALTSGAVNILSIIGALFALLLIAVIYNSVRLSRQASRSARRRFAVGLLLLGFGILALIVFSLALLPFGLALGYPYFAVEMDIGGLIAGIGAILVNISALLSL